MKIQPFGERVAIKVIPLEEKTSGGLIVATSKEQSNRGEVIAVSEEVKGISVGELVIFTLGSGVSYTDGTEDYKIINIKDIIGKIIKGE